MKRNFASFKQAYQTYLSYRICHEFESIEQVALNAPKSTKSMIELGEFMLNVKNKTIVDLNVSLHLYIFVYVMP